MHRSQRSLAASRAELPGSNQTRGIAISVAVSVAVSVPIPLAIPLRPFAALARRPGQFVLQPQLFQRPAAAELDAVVLVDVDHIVPGFQIIAHPVDQSEFFIVRTVYPDLRRGEGFGNIGQKVRQGPAGVGNCFIKSRRGKS